MAKKQKAIEGKCMMFACRICRTKVGWPHQSWCTFSHITMPDCGDCRYYSAEDKQCIHPLKRNGGVEA